jgi:transcriptional regulator with XRE-family HTH domain
MSLEIGEIIAAERDAAGLTQKQLADRLGGVHQTSISRIEKGQASPDLMFEHVLKAIGTPTALQWTNIIRFDWKHLPHPSYRHPNLADLIKIEEALGELSNFDEFNPNKTDAGRKDLLVRRLTDAADFIFQLDHRINYVGEIGVGKTTAICRQTGLVADPTRPDDLRSMMLDTGGGRTTLCDVIIQKGKHYAFLVEPLTDDEIYRLAGELCRSAFEQDAVSVASVDFRPAEEVVRALRNMTGMARSSRSRLSPNTPTDPLKELAQQHDNLESFQAAFTAKLALWRRKRRELDYEGSDDLAGRFWFKERFAEINNGKNPDVSLPAAIVASVPFPPVRNTPFYVTAVDTRGIDGSSIRPDIVTRIRDDRAITVLCCRWGSAPDAAIQTLLTHLKETELDPNLSKRLAILIIARPGDALSMRHESGESVESVEEGYEIKLRHAQDALTREQLPSLAAFAFDSTQDPDEGLQSFLIERLADLRSVHLEGARQTINAVREMLTNAEEAKAVAAVTAVTADMQRFVDQHPFLQGRPTSIYPRLFVAIKDAHPRAIWASTRRNGRYWNFDFYQYLEDGAAAIMRHRSYHAMNSLRIIIQSKMEDINFSGAQAFLAQLLDDSMKWEVDLVEAARHFAGAVFEPKLRSAESLWRHCESLYGQGLPYRDRVVSELREWSTRNSELEQELEARFQLAWQESIIAPVRRLTGGSLD